MQKNQLLNPRTKSAGSARAGKRSLSAQQTIPYVEMLKDGICRVREGFYTKTIAYEDINYSVASSEDQSAIFDGWCGFLNYFDSALPFQLSFINHRSRGGSRYKVNIPMAHDDFDSIRGEYVDMLKRQIARSNNGIVRSKYITFGVPADGLETARPRLERVSSDIMGNFKKLGAHSRVLNGRERLEVLHGQMHPGGREPFRFSWPDIVKTGMGTKDFIAPDSFDFSASRTFRVGQSWGAASYLQIMASELSDKLLLELLELDAEMTVTLHVQTVDQLKAIKMTKGKISDIDKMKVEEQKKAVRAGYDMEILPPDLITYSKDAAALLADLQSRNERMFLLTFTVVNIAPTRQKLENDVFTISGIAQKYNCALKRLDWQQEQGFTSSLVLGDNAIEIQRGMTTSTTAIFIPFMTKELRMDGAALYYGMNALSNNVIMADRKRLKNPNGLFLGTPGSGKSFRRQAGDRQRVPHPPGRRHYHSRPGGGILPPGEPAGRAGGAAVPIGHGGHVHQPHGHQPQLRRRRGPAVPQKRFHSLPVRADRGRTERAGPGGKDGDRPLRADHLPALSGGPGPGAYAHSPGPLR